MSAHPEGAPAGAAGEPGMNQEAPSDGKDRPRHGWAPADALLGSIRLYQRHSGRPGLAAKALRRLARAAHAFWSIVTASDIRPQARLGRNLRMPHPTGVVIHHDAVVGDDCILMQQVTIGQLSGPGAPVLEDGVYVGAGAKVLGAIRIGTGARIGANAVVMQDVPAHCTAVGIPARILRRAEADAAAPLSEAAR